MNIRQIDYQQYKGEINRFSLPSASAEYVEFCEKFWQARPVFIGVFNDSGNKLKAVLPLFQRQENGMAILEGAVKTYTEVLNIDSDTALNLNIDLFAAFIKKNYKFDLLDLSICPIINKEIAKLNNFRARTAAYAAKIEERDSERVFKEIIGKKSRNQTRLAYKNGLTKELGGDIEKFYLLYQSSMQRLGAVPKEKKYFYDLKSAFGDNFHVLFALKGGKAVGANLWVVKNQYLSLMFNASDKEYWNICVNNFLYWEMILWGLKNNIIWFDYGINAPRDREQIHFKESYGASACPICHFLVIKTPGAYFKIYRKKLVFLCKLLIKKVKR